MIHERKDDIPVEQQAFALTGMGHIRELVRGNVQLLRQDLAVTGSLIQHIHEIRVLKDVLHLAAGQQVVG